MMNAAGYNILLIIILLQLLFVQSVPANGFSALSGCGAHASRKKEKETQSSFEAQGNPILKYGLPGKYSGKYQSDFLLKYLSGRTIRFVPVAKFSNLSAKSCPRIASKIPHYLLFRVLII